MRENALAQTGYRGFQLKLSYLLRGMFCLFVIVGYFFSPHVKAANKPSRSNLTIGNITAYNGDPSLKKPYFYGIFDAAGFSDGIYYGRSPIHPFNYHEFLSGEWGAAIYYDGIDTNSKAMWLTDEFLYPDWPTYNDFIIDPSYTPRAWQDPNNNPSPLVDTGRSVIKNSKVQIQIDYEVVDLAFGDPNNNTSRSPLAYYKQDGMSSLYMPSDRYIFLQTHSITNKDLNNQTLTNIEFYQMLHSHGANQYGPVVNSTYDSIAYDDPLENYTPYNPVHTVGNFRYDITQWNSNLHQDWVGFSSTVEPNWIDSDVYEGHSDKPPIGTHINIENRTLNGVTEIYNNQVAGAMGWSLGSLDPNDTVSITIAYMWGRGEPVKESLILKKYDDIDDATCGIDPSDPNNNEITYTIYCSNPPVGDPNYIGTVNDVVITDYLPNGTDPCDVTVSEGGTFDMFANTVTWNIGTLEPGDANSFTVTIKVLDGEPASEVVNTAILTSDVGWVKAVEATPVCCYGGSIIYVDDTASGSNTGLNWNDAYNDLQAALTRASECTTTEIWVASGIYMPDVINGSQTTSFDLMNDIEIYGGFNGTETSRSERDFPKNKTVLSGDIDPDGNSDTDKIVYADSTITSSTILDGFIITDGDDGIYCDSGNPTIKNCVIADNHDDGIYCTGSNISISWSIIKDNGGDGFECYGSGKTPTITNVKIRDNDDHGIYSQSSVPVIKNNWIVNNGAAGSGYGVYLSSPSAEATVRNNTIAYNTDEGVYRNTSGTAPAICDCIIWQNNSDDNYVQVTGCFATYSCITDPNDVNGTATGAATPDGNGNIYANPYFAYTDPNLSDYHLHPDSPCVDAGDPCDTYDGEKDIDGDDRVLNGVDYSPDNGRVDMGADEVACDDIYNSLDWNIDAIVDIEELIIIADAWLSDPCSDNWNPDCDLQPETGDGDVDFGDFAAFGSEWLWQPCWSSSGTGGVWMMMGAGGGESMMMEMMSMMTCGASAPVAFEPAATMSLEANDAYVVDEVANQLLETQRQFEMDQLTEARNQKAYYESSSPSEPSAEEQIEQIKELLDWLYEVRDEIDEDTWLHLTATLEEMLKELEAD